jgi:orotidine-5'-phosphate decarboxylase
VVNPIIVALDVPSAEEAVRLAHRLAPHVRGFKVGLGLLHGPGPGVVGALAQLGEVFADAKLHDIPSQVERAARRLGEYGARWVTVHASGGVEMMQAARSGLESRSKIGGILAVTVLTSLDAPSLAALGLGNRPGRLVSRLAKAAAAAGVEGIVCSARELGDVAQVAPGLVRVTPGIRPDGPTEDDQRRVATPEEALERGADLLVVGRPITGAADPEEAAATLAIRLGIHSR